MTLLRIAWIHSSIGIYTSVVQRDCICLCRRSIAGIWPLFQTLRQGARFRMISKSLFPKSLFSTEETISQKIIRKTRKMGNLNKCNRNPTQIQMKYWLIKGEGASRLEKGVDVKFTIEDLANVNTTPWEGVRNYEAVKRQNVSLCRETSCATK